jgi:hypothetical protein
MSRQVIFLGGCAHGWKTEDPEQERFVAVQFPTPPAPLRIFADISGAELKRDVYQRHAIFTNSEIGTSHIVVYVLAGLELLDGVAMGLLDCNRYRSQP